MAILLLNFNCDKTQSSLMASTAGTNSSANTSKPVNPPEVVKFAFTEFSVDTKENKWKAKCRTCSELISETRGTSTGFSR